MEALKENNFPPYLQYISLILNSVFTYFCFPRQLVIKAVPMVVHYCYEPLSFEGVCSFWLSKLNKIKNTPYLA